MITLEEKRLQDLEARIPVFLAKIAEQQSKMAEIYSFPNDLAEVRTICETLNGVLKDFMDSQHVSWDSSNSRIFGFWKELNDLKASIDNEVKSNLANMSNQIAGLFGASDNQNALQLALENNHKDLIQSLAFVSERVASTENKIEKGSQVISSVYEKLNDQLVDHNNLKVSLEAQVSQVSQDLKQAIISLQEYVNNQVANVTSKIKDFPEIPVPKDYDEVIADIKSDIKALQVPSIQIDPKVNEKIKSLEQAIAQIFTILKKLEPGS